MHVYTSTRNLSLKRNFAIRRSKAGGDVQLSFGCDAWAFCSVEELVAIRDAITEFLAAPPQEEPEAHREPVREDTDG